ncbi:hypothetical protein [Ruminococcus sp.]|uniref:hypothetical protein n=1 Tax=Ruminococcus sp. TaxID=41978 RepID=UPI0025FE5320|nr:hypothetical protein [Ruminococcus sp.]
MIYLILAAILIFFLVKVFRKRGIIGRIIKIILCILVSTGVIILLAAILPTLHGYIEYVWDYDSLPLIGFTLLGLVVLIILHIIAVKKLYVASGKLLFSEIILVGITFVSVYFELGIFPPLTIILFIVYKIVASRKKVNKYIKKYISKNGVTSVDNFNTEFAKGKSGNWRTKIDKKPANEYAEQLYCDLADHVIQDTVNQFAVENPRVILFSEFSRFDNYLKSTKKTLQRYLPKESISYCDGNFIRNISSKSQDAFCTKEALSQMNDNLCASLDAYLDQNIDPHRIEQFKFALNPLLVQYVPTYVKADEVRNALAENAVKTLTESGKVSKEFSGVYIKINSNGQPGDTQQEEIHNGLPMDNDIKDEEDKLDDLEGCPK